MNFPCLHLCSRWHVISPVKEKWVRFERNSSISAAFEDPTTWTWRLFSEATYLQLAVGRLCVAALAAINFFTHLLLPSFLEEMFSLQQKQWNWWHLVKEKGSSLFWLHSNVTTLTASAALFLSLHAGGVGGLAVVGGAGGVIKEHSCTLCLNRHCVQINIHLES